MSALSLALLLAATSPGATARVWEVATDGSGDFTSIQAAIDAASPSDSIEVAPGTYWESLDFSGKSVEVRSQGGAETTLLDASSFPTATLRLLAGESPTVEGFTLRHDGGRGIDLNGGSPIFRNLVLDGIGTPSEAGGSVQAQGGSPTFSDCVFQGGEATEGAHGYFVDSTPTFTDCTFTSGQATLGGSLRILGGSLTMSGGTFDANGGEGWESTDSCGAVSLDEAAAASFSGTLFTGNRGFYGGALCLDGGAEALLSATTFDLNYGYNGAAVSVVGGSSLTDVGSTFHANTSNNQAGGVYGTASFLSLDGTTFHQNVSYYGGAISADTGTTLQVSNSLLDENVGYYAGGHVYLYNMNIATVFIDTTFRDGRCPYSSGGAIYANYLAPLFLSGCTFTGNEGRYGGGGIFAYVSEVTAVDSVFESNLAEEGAGGALLVSDADWGAFPVTLTGCDFLANQSLNQGGGISLTQASQIQVSDCRFRGNTAGYQAAGGGLAVDVAGSVSLLRNSFAENVAGYGGGAYLSEVAGPSHQWLNNVFQENLAGDGGGLCLVKSAAVQVVNNVLAGNAATRDASALCLVESGVDFRNNAVVYSGDAAAVTAYDGPSAGSSTFSYNDFHSNAGGDGGGELPPSSLTGNGNRTDPPGFAGYTLDGDPDNDSFVLARDSLLIDAGDPALFDQDGSVSDIGAWGGPAVVAVDADGDGFLSDVDCNDQEASAHPGGGEVWYDGINQDCGQGSDFDQDGDGADAEEQGGSDCDDTDASVQEDCGEEPGDDDSASDDDTVPQDDDTSPAGDDDDVSADDDGSGDPDGGCSGCNAGSSRGGGAGWWGGVVWALGRRRRTIPIRGR